jgi:hypothetical protein
MSLRRWTRRNSSQGDEFHHQQLVDARGCPSRGRANGKGRSRLATRASQLRPETNTSMNLLLIHQLKPIPDQRPLGNALMPA